MPIKRITYSNYYRAIEAYSVLVRGQRPSRSFTLTEIKRELSNPEMYVDFLKVCLESDRSTDLRTFKKGLSLVIRAVGVKSVEDQTGIHRSTLYRMCQPEGNPELSSFLKVLEALGIRLWVVDREFIHRGSSIRRLKKEIPPEVIDYGEKRNGKQVGLTMAQFERALRAIETEEL